MKFRYEAMDRSGRATRGSIEAATALEATDLLSQKGLFIESIAAQGDGAASGGGSDRLKSLGTSKTRLVANFCRDLSVLVSTGTPLADALDALERQTRHPGFREVVGGVLGKIQDGSALGEALGEYPEYFDAVFRSLIAAGEAGGNLDEMLVRLAELTERQARTRSAVIGSLTYPVALSILCLVVLLVVFTLVLPRFAGMFASLDVALPASTEVMLAISGVVRGYWWAIVGVLVVGVGGLVYAVRDAGVRERGVVWLLGFPVIGPLLKNFALARIARMMGTLIGASVPFLESVELTRDGISNPAYKGLMDRAEKYVMEGDSVSNAFNDSSLVSPAFAEALRAGEQSGRIGPVLSKLADHMDLDNEERLKAVTKLAEPMILSFLGVVVGIVAVSLFLPLFDLTASAGGGGR